MRKLIVNSSAGVFLLGVTACANLPEITQMQPTALNYNKVVSGLKNELILLNIARASQRQPMHFTRITGITNSTTMTGTASLGVNIPERSRTFENTSDGESNLTSAVEKIGSTADTLTPNIGGSVALNPVFNYEVLDSKEFYNGILAPLSADRFLLYQSQGWPTEFLALMMIEKVSFSCASDVKDCGEPVVYDNNPDNTGHINDFRDFIEVAKFSPAKRETAPGKDFIISSVLGGEDLSKLADVLAKPKWSAKSQNTVTYTTGGGTGIGVNYSNIPDLQTLQDKQSASCVTDSTDGDKNFSIALQTSQESLLENDISSNDVCDADLEVSITFRSTSGVIYYLGECLRQDSSPCYYKSGDKTHYVSRIQTSGNENHKLKKGNLRTSLNGDEYWVPRAEAVSADKKVVDRTYSAISFVNQLLNLQQDEKEAPTTTTVIGLN